MGFMMHGSGTIILLWYSPEEVDIYQGYNLPYQAKSSFRNRWFYSLKSGEREKYTTVKVLSIDCSTLVLTVFLHTNFCEKMQKSERITSFPHLIARHIYSIIFAFIFALTVWCCKNIFIVLLTLLSLEANLWRPS